MNRHIRLVIGCATLVLLSLSPAVARADFELDHTSQRLAYCGDVYSYAAQWFLLQNNPGAARTMIPQFSRATVGLFSLHYKDGSVAGERVAAFKAEGRKAKPFLDSHPSEVLTTIDSCVTRTKYFKGRSIQKS